MIQESDRSPEQVQCIRRRVGGCERGRGGDVGAVHQSEGEEGSLLDQVSGEGEGGKEEGQRRE